MSENSNETGKGLVVRIDEFGNIEHGVFGKLTQVDILAIRKYLEEAPLENIRKITTSVLDILKETVFILQNLKMIEEMEKEDVRRTSSRNTDLPRIPVDLQQVTKCDKKTNDISDA